MIITFVYPKKYAAWAKRYEKERNYKLPKDSFFSFVEDIALPKQHKSNSSIVVLLPGAVVPTYVIEDANIIPILDRPLETSQDRYNTIVYLSRAKAVACDYTVWASLPDFFKNTRHIDLTGSSFVFDEVENRLTDTFDILYCGDPDGSFANYLKTSWKEKQELQKKVTRNIYFGDVFSSALVSPENTVAFITDTYSMLHMYSIVRSFPLTVYPVTGSNGSHIAGIDPRGASGSIATIASMDAAKIGRAGSSVAAWDDLLHDVKGLIESMRTFEYIRPAVNDVIMRMFIEINKSGF